MLRTILLLIVSVLSTQSFAGDFTIKYKDYTNNSVTTESFVKLDDFTNRLSELEYINHSSIKILQTGHEATRSDLKLNQVVIEMAKQGGEGVGE